MGVLGRTFARIFPGWAVSRATARIDLMRLELQERAVTSVLQGMPGDSPYVGASGRRSMQNWGPSSGDADADLLQSLPLLRDRSQDLFRNSPAGRGVVKRIVTGAVGAGLTMRSTIDRALLALSDEEARAWEDAAEREFGMWSNSRECDFSRRMSFAEIQQLAFTSQKVRGDCFIIMTWVPRTGVTYDLRLQLIEADRVSNPDYNADSETIAGGIERDKNGIPVAIHVQTVHPGSQYLYVTVRPKWERIPIFGTHSGRRQVLHLMECERIDQSRGEPSLAPVVETLKQLTRYSDAELSAAVINALLTVFIKRPLEGDSLTGQNVEYTDAQRVLWENRNLKLGPGTWVEGAPGEEIQTVAANRPNAQFDPFFAACLKQIGMALGVPYEVLAQVFQSSYSASRAALLEFAKNMKVSRAWLRNNFCQMVYEEFLTEAVVKGRLHAPGFLDDPIIRNAYCRAEWMGPSVGQIDPVKEVTAAIMKCVCGFSTWGRETAELSGADFEQTTYTRAKEIGLLKQLNLLFDSIFKLAGTTFEDREGQERRDSDREGGDSNAA